MMTMNGGRQKEYVEIRYSPVRTGEKSASKRRAEKRGTYLCCCSMSVRLSVCLSRWCIMSKQIKESHRHSTFLALN